MKDQSGRNRLAIEEVFSGRSCAYAGRKFFISGNRVHQIVHIFCKRQNEKLWLQLRNGETIPRISNLRLHAKEFLDAEPSGVTLPIHAVNALRHCLWVSRDWDDHDPGPPPKNIVADLTYDHVRRMPGIGKLGLKKIVEWLAEDGLTLKDMPTKYIVDLSDKQMADGLAEFLRGRGWTVIPPTTDSEPPAPAPAA